MAHRNLPVWPRLANRPSSTPPTPVDYQSITVRLDNVASRLFKQDGTVEIMACQWSKHQKFQNRPLRSFDELRTYIDNTSGSADPSTRGTTDLFIVDQEHTKASLNVTYDAMKALLSHIPAFPQLANALPEFTASDVPIHGSRTLFNANSSNKSTNSIANELYMLLKYVEPNGNGSDPIPWSIRQQLFYQSFDADSLREKCIAIRPSATFKSRIVDEFMLRGGIPCHWTNLPLLLVGSLPANWSAYARFLDEKIWSLDKSVNFTNPFSETLGEANFKSLPQTKHYHDLLTRSAHALKLNIHVLRLLLKESSKRFELENKTSCVQFSAHYTALEGIANDVIEEFQGLVEYLHLLKARLDRISEAIRDSIALRNSYHAAIESQNMKQLTLKSVKEARTVKAIALVTLVYLPATFVAETFLGINGIDIRRSQSGVLHIEADAQVGLYFALTIPLTVATLLLWWVWERLSRSRSSELDVRTASLEKPNGSSV